MPYTKPVVYLMRGLPHCGKSYTSTKLAGTTGVVCETDNYFFTQVGSDPKKYEWSDELLPAARAWNFENFVQAVEAKRTPIIVDRGCARDKLTQIYVNYAIYHGYQVVLKEPESPWWKLIRSLLRNKEANWPTLVKWAKILEQKSKAYHKVSAQTILKLMEIWESDISVDDIVGV